MTYDTQGRRVLQGHPSRWEDECEELRRDYGLMQIDRNNLRSLLDATETKADELHDKLDDAQSEAKALRARVQELEAENGIIRTDKHADAECIGHLERRVRKLEAALQEIAGLQIICASDMARAALQKQEGE